MCLKNSDPAILEIYPIFKHKSQEKLAGKEDKTGTTQVLQAYINDALTFIHTHKKIHSRRTNQPNLSTSHENNLKIMLHLTETVKLQYPLQTFQELQIIILFLSELPL